MKILNLILMGSLMLPSFAFPISRIGGGKISSDRSLFEANLSLLFQRVPNGNRILHAFTLPPNLTMGRVDQGQLLLSEFADLFPELQSLSREDLKTAFLENGFERKTYTFDLDECIEVFFKSHTSTDQYVLTWGGGKGILMNITKDRQTQFDGLNLVKSIELFEGACSWN